MSKYRCEIVEGPDGLEIHRVTTSPVGYINKEGIDATRERVAELCGTKLAANMDALSIARAALVVAQQGVILTTTAVAREILRHVRFADVPEHRAALREEME